MQLRIFWKPELLHFLYRNTDFLYRVLTRFAMFREINTNNIFQSSVNRKKRSNFNVNMTNFNGRTANIFFMFPTRREQIFLKQKYRVHILFPNNGNKKLLPNYCRATIFLFPLTWNKQQGEINFALIFCVKFSFRKTFARANL